MTKTQATRGGDAPRAVPRNDARRRRRPALRTGCRGRMTERGRPELSAVAPAYGMPPARRDDVEDPTRRCRPLTPGRPTMSGEPPAGARSGRPCRIFEPWKVRTVRRKVGHNFIVPPDLVVQNHTTNRLDIVDQRPYYLADVLRLFDCGGRRTRYRRTGSALLEGADPFLSKIARRRVLRFADVTPQKQLSESSQTSTCAFELGLHMARHASMLSDQGNE